MKICLGIRMSRNVLTVPPVDPKKDAPFKNERGTTRHYHPPFPAMRHEPFIFTFTK